MEPTLPTLNNHTVLEAMETEEEIQKIQKKSNTQAENLNAGGRKIKSKSKAGQRCEKIINYIWTTRASIQRKKLDNDIYLMTSLRELFIYIIFVIILLIIAFGGVETRSYYYSSVVEALFIDESFQSGTNKDITFKTITNYDQFWTYLEDIFPNRLLWSDNWFNIENKSNRPMLFFDITMVGVARLRQLRSSKEACSSDILSVSCYAKYNIFLEDTKPIIRNNTKWYYFDSSISKGSTYSGSISFYGSGGYIVDLTTNENTTQNIVRELREKSWIDRGTRAVFVDFVVYNSNLNLFCKIRLAFEFPNFGGIVTGYDIKPAKLMRYVTSMDYFIMACEILFIIYVVYYFIELLLEFIEVKLREFFTNFWNILDILVLIISISCIGFNISRIIHVNESLDQVLKDSNTYPNLDAISYYERIFQHAIAICVFLVILKIFKYISFNRTMTHLSSTLGRSMKEVLGFCVMFLIIFAAFAQMAYLLFSSNATDFREFHTSILSQFRIILGDFNFQELALANKFLGEIYFVLYVFFVFFVLINMFVAIICDNYVEVKHDETINDQTVSMSSFIRKKTAAVLEKLNVKAKKIMDLEDTINFGDTNNDSYLGFDEWRAALKGKGYADCEIEAVFAKYDLDGDQVLNPYEQQMMKEQLEGEKKQISETIKKEKRLSQRKGHSNFGLQFPGESLDNDIQTVSRDEIKMLDDRIDSIQDNLKLILLKIDQVFQDMENMEIQNVAFRKAIRQMVDMCGSSSILRK